jgi:hypothetical protein
MTAAQPSATSRNQWQKVALLPTTKTHAQPRNHSLRREGEKVAPPRAAPGSVSRLAPGPRSCLRLRSPGARRASPRKSAHLQDRNTALRTGRHQVKRKPDRTAERPNYASDNRTERRAAGCRYGQGAGCFTRDGGRKPSKSKRRAGLMDRASRHASVALLRGIVAGDGRRI